MDLMMNALKRRVSNNLDDLVHQTDSPFTTSVTSFPLPSKFHMLQVEKYDGNKDPLDHLESFKTLMHFQEIPNEIMCKVFPTTLKGPVRIWFSKLTPNFISSFKELSTQFASHFIRGHRYKKSTACLMNIKQWEDETLRSYITHFNKEALSIDEADNKMLVAAFTNGLQKGKFLFSLCMNDPKTMSDVLYRATKYMNAKDALLVQEEKLRKRERNEDNQQNKGQKMVPINAPFIGFGRTKMFPLGTVTLSVTVKDYPQQIIKDVTFPVVDYSFTYNSILERPTLNSWKAVTSTYHLMIEFPTDYGVGELWGNQVAGRECYIAMLEMDDHQQAMCIEEQQAIAEPVEELEEVTLDESKPERMTRMGTLSSRTVR